MGLFERYWALLQRDRALLWTTPSSELTQGIVGVTSILLLHPRSLQHAATRCNTLEHAATRYKTLQHAATRCNTLHHAATRCNTLQHAATRCNTLQRAVTKKSKWESSRRCCFIQSLVRT